MDRRQEEADGVVHVGGRTDELGLLQQRGHRLVDLVLRHRQRLEHRAHGLTEVGHRRALQPLNATRPSYVNSFVYASFVPFMLWNGRGSFYRRVPSFV